MHADVVYARELCKKLCINLFNQMGKKPKKRAAK